MQFVIIYMEKRKKTREIVEGLAIGLREGGHQVILEEISSGKPLQVMNYDKVIIGCDPEGFWKKRTPSHLKEALGKAKGIMGKKTIVFVQPSFIRNNQALRSVMNDVERLSGAFVENFVFLRNSKEGKAFGKSL